MNRISWQQILSRLDTIAKNTTDPQAATLASYLAVYLRRNKSRIPNFFDTATYPISVEQLQTVIWVALLHLQYSSSTYTESFRQDLMGAGVTLAMPPQPAPACPISLLQENTPVLRLIEQCCNHLPIDELGPCVREYFEDAKLLRACQLLVRVDFRSRIIEGTLQSTKGPIAIETTRIPTDVDVPYIEIKLCIGEQHVVFVFKKGDEWGHSVKITSVHGTEDELCNLIRFVCTHKLKIQPAT